MGRNGAGKTTTMKMLLNLIQPSGGKICLFGENHSDFRKKHYHRIGSIIESPAFYENLTAEENLEILARLSRTYLLHFRLRSHWKQSPAAV